MYRSNINNEPTFPRAGKVKIKVSMITLNDFYFLNSFNTLNNLKVLTTVVAEPPDILSTLDMKDPTRESTTTAKSKLFQLSLKYLLPNPIIFIAASKVKIITKTLFRIDSTNSTLYGLPYQLMVSNKVLSIMAM